MRAAYFLGGKIGYVAGLLNSQLNARQRFRLKALRLFSARETVISDTLASFATSFREAIVLLRECSA